MDETQKDLEITRQFVEKNTVLSDDDNIVCGDGRYTPEQSGGAIRAFGGDFGIVMAIQGAMLDQGIEKTEEEVVDRYMNAVRKLREEEGGHYHSDEHNHKEGQIDCGHIAKSSNPELSHLYTPLDAARVRNLYAAFDKHESTGQTVLEGKHAERGVLLVYGPEHKSNPRYSVNSLDPKTSEMYFVVDVHRAERFMEAVVPLFSRGLDSHVDVAKVKENFTRQMSATASLLAPNLMQYSVVFGSEGKATVSQLARVKPFQQE